VTIFPSINRTDIGDWHQDVVRPTVEAGLKANEVVIETQLIRCRNGCVQNDFTISRVALRHDRALVNRHGEIRSEPVIGTPFVDGPNEVRLRRGVGHQEFTGA
jgi:hypothetical protein